MNTQSAPVIKDEARVLYLTGLREQSEGRIDQAIEYFDAALRIRPDFPEALCSGGFILERRGHFDGALAFYGRAIELAPDYFDALFNRGCLHFGLKRVADAAQDFKDAAAVMPNDVGVWSNLGAALYRLGRLDEAVDALRRALKIDPSMLEAELNLGSSLRRLGRDLEAREAFMRAVKRHPNCAEAYCGLGIVSRALGAFDLAVTYYDKALDLQPDLQEAISSKGCLQLLKGDFAQGWDAYEHRWIEGERPVPQSEARFDLADPSTMQGKRILVVQDHGLGDMIQFFRYAALLSQHGAHVTIAGPAKMRKLLASSGCAMEWRPSTDLEGDFDEKIAISSLPRAFATRLDTIPANVPYLTADAERAAFWRERMPGKGLKVGLCWRGSQDFRVDPRRSIPPSALIPLSELDNVSLYALHMDVAADELPGQLGQKITVFGDDFDRGPDAFVDTAAVMANLDLIVTCDTSIAHLAGALNRPVWVALRHVAEWRWMDGREDSPWYPSMRLLRSGRGDAWPALFKKIADEIRALSAQGSPAND